MTEKEYQYKTNFLCDKIQSISLAQENISKASLENLGILIPHGEVDFQANTDLIGVAFNAAVVNQFNRNDDGVDTDTAFRLANLFRHKPTNIEHNREKVVGHILTAGFSSFETSEMLLPESLIGSTDPFNLSLGAVAYKFVNKDFADALVGSCDPESHSYNKIATSWELGFNSFNIALGSKNLNEAEIISDLNQIKELKARLRAYGGDGKMKDGTPIYRLVTGEVFPLGIGYTTNPAADVSGVLVDSENKTYETDTKAKVYFFKSHFFSKKNSQDKIQAVNLEKESIMNLEPIFAELKDMLTEKKVSEQAVASMTDTFTKAIKQKDEEYKAELTASKDAAESAIKERESLKASVEEVQKQLAEALEKIAEFELSRKTSEILARFNSRMEEVDSMFELDDEDRKIVAEDIKSLSESDEVFASFKNKLSVIWKHKSKAAKADYDKELNDRVEAELQKRLETLSASGGQTRETVEDILEKTKASEAGLPNNNQSSSSEGTKTVVERFASAFSKENVTVS